MKALSGTPVPIDIGSHGYGEHATATVSAAMVWKSPAINCNLHRHGMSEISRPSSRSPLRRSMSVACKAFATMGATEAVEEVEFKQKETRENEKGVPVFVMMPLDSVKMDNTVNRRKAMEASLQALKSAGVKGIMMDVWWGLVERENPGQYNWGGYVDLIEMAHKYDLKVQAVMSFHQCGGNVGDSVTYVC